MDFELEIGAVIGREIEHGRQVSPESALDHVFGFCLLNDWSARGVQAWEMQPLGPFLSKSFATTISPWIITREALAPFRTATRRRDADEPEILPYLRSESDAAFGAYDIALEAHISSRRMREENLPPQRVTNTNFKHCYWSVAQMVTHHTSNGCDLRPGDMIGTGTLSGPEDHERACLAELTVRGTKPVVLPTGEDRRWLEDWDEVRLSARASRDGFVTIGFGECAGLLEPAAPIAS